MISLILYGRNDSYGYNLHRRAAISLNCMAEVLDAPDDEILFVDYNTPDDFPTFPEAIQDTLTERAKRLLRILRVRPRHHERFRSRTRLLALEPIARNVALRRSNPANRWILSTNTDMVFVPQRGALLSEVAVGLPDAYYALPRFEVPETLWESADRLDPKGTIARFGEWGRAFHLNEIVLSSDPTVRYDAPGDFQLALRSDLWDIHGFNEAMLLGWHVDSNLAKRMSLIPRSTQDVLDDVIGYHCDHTRQVTPAHRHRAVENDLETFVGEVTRAELPEQAETWGLAGETIEELTVNATSRLYLGALESATPGPLDGPMPRLPYTYENHNKVDYTVEHVLPFIVDAFASFPRETVVGWFGSKRSLIERFAEAWKALGFTRGIMIPSSATWLGSEISGCTWTNDETLIATADVFVFDFGRRDDVAPEQWHFPQDIAVDGTLRSLRKAVLAERRLLENGSEPRRFVGINAVCNDVEAIFHNLIAAARTPIATRIRQGYVNDLLSQDLLPSLNSGSAGRRMPAGIASRPETLGCVFYVPHLLLDPATYRLRLEFAAEPQAGNPGLGLLVTTGGCVLCDRSLNGDDIAAGHATIEFTVPPVDGDWPEAEFLLHTLGRVDIVFRRALLEKIGRVVEQAPVLDVLPLLTLGAAGEHRADPSNPEGLAIGSRAGVRDFLAYGPHVWLLPGRYEVTFEFWTRDHPSDCYVDARVEVASAFGERILAEHLVSFSEQRARCSLAFDLSSRPPRLEEGRLEFRVWSAGGEFCLTAVTVRRISEPQAPEAALGRLIPGLHNQTLEAVARQTRRGFVQGLPAKNLVGLASIGDAGRRVGKAVEAVRERSGAVIYGPYLWFYEGTYEVTFDLSISPGQAEAYIKLEVANHSGQRCLAASFVDVNVARGPLTRLLRRHQPVPVSTSLRFEMPSDVPTANDKLLEFRVWTSGGAEFAVTGVRVREIDPGEVPAATTRRDSSSSSRHHEVMPALTVGPAAQRDRRGISSVGSPGYVAYGPYLPLAPGRYEVTFDGAIRRAARKSELRFDVAAQGGTRVFTESVVHPRRGRLHHRLLFDVRVDAVYTSPGFEFRIWSAGGCVLTLSSVRFHCVADYAGVETTALPSP